MFPDPDSTSGGPPQKDRRRVPRRRKRILLIAGTGFALVAILLLLALGPAFPALARRAALQAAASQGMTGDLRVEGSLFSGFSLHDIALSGGDSPLVSLSLESLAIEYDFPALLTRAPEFHWLKRLHLQRAIIDLSLPLPQKGDSSADSESRPTREAPLDSFSPIWNLLAADIDIGEISIRVKTGEETYEIGSLSLKLPPRSDGEISLGQLTLPGRKPISGLAARIERDERRITLTDLAGKEVETLQSLSLSEPEPGDWIVDALLELGGGKLTVSAATAGTAALSLRRGDTIALSELPFEDGPALKGTVSDLDLRFTGDFETPSSWQIDGKILGQGLGVDAFLTDSLAVIIKENRIQLDLLAPGTRLSGTASAPLETVETTGALARHARQPLRPMATRRGGNAPESMGNRSSGHRRSRLPG